MKIAIVDTDLNMTSRLERQIAAYGEARGFSVEISCISDICAFVDSFNVWQYQVVLLNLDLSDLPSGLSGMEVARALHKRDPRCLLILMAEDDGRMMDAFSVHAYAYLLKNRLEDLPGILDDVGTIISYSRALNISSREHNCTVLYNDILYACMEGHYAIVTDVRNKQWRTRTTFQKLKKELSFSEGFISVNKGVLVNMMYVSQIEDEDCIMKDGKNFLIRVRGRSEIAQQLRAYHRSVGAAG